MNHFPARTMLLAIVCLLFCKPFMQAQADSAYAFIVAGHAYGSHDGDNTGLHPAFLNSLASGYDSSAAFIVLTGDIVNRSNLESWQQVENELTTIGLPSYYVMGNHGDNDIGWQVFEDKYGATYYAFLWQSELYIVLNSTEQGRSISSGQLDFLYEQISLAGDSIQSIFVFFHEVLWNSKEKYAGVKSNSRSRYDQMVNYSNYWEDVHPMFVREAEKNFYVITGDVGGNPDAIAAFYDKQDNVTLLSSGMGEVVDENYLLVRVDPGDSIAIKLVPLDKGLEIPPLEYYSVPLAPDSISGPASIAPGGSTGTYSVSEVINADSYEWDLPMGAIGSGTTSQVELTFDAEFSEGEISARAARDGFGSGPSVSMTVHADLIPDHLLKRNAGGLKSMLAETAHGICITIHSAPGEGCDIHIFDINGRTIRSLRSSNHTGNIQLEISKNDLSEGIIFLSVTTPRQTLTRKIQVN